MFDYLTKFEKLPSEIQQAVSSPAALKVISELEKKYGIDLDVDVVKIIVRDITWPGVAAYFMREHNLTNQQAENLRQALQEKLFAHVMGYLNKTEGAAIADQKEIAMSNTDIKKELEKSIEQFERKQKPQITADILKELMRLAGITAEQRELANRLQVIAIVYNKGIRDLIDTRETLMKNKVAGGLGLSAERAEAVVARLKKIRQAESVQTKTVEHPKSPFDSLELTADVEYNFSDPVPVKKALDNKIQSASSQKGLGEFSQSELEHQLAPPPPMIRRGVVTKKDNRNFSIRPQQTPSFQVSMADMKKIENEIKEQKNLNTPKKNETPQHTPRMVRSLPTEEKIEKKRLNDIIKPRPAHLQGPMEELASMDLASFNRLGETAEIMANKIKQKISLLEEESMTKRQAGVNAWRHSPVYKMYLALGEESIKKRVPIETIILKKIKNGERILNLDQFNAILELNRQLQY